MELEANVRNGQRRKMVAIYDRVFYLAIAENWEQLQRLINIVAERSHPEIRLSAELATDIVLRKSGNVVDRSPLMSKANEYRDEYLTQAAVE